MFYDVFTTQYKTHGFYNGFSPQYNYKTHVFYDAWAYLGPCRTEHTCFTMLFHPMQNTRVLRCFPTPNTKHTCFTMLFPPNCSQRPPSAWPGSKSRKPAKAYYCRFLAYFLREKSWKWSRNTAIAYYCNPKSARGDPPPALHFLVVLELNHRKTRAFCYF